MALQPLPAKPAKGAEWMSLGDALYNNVTEITTDWPTVKADINTKAPLASPAFTGAVTGITKDMIGLGNVDNVAVASMTIAASQLTGTIDPARLPSGSTLAYNPTAAQISGMDAGTLYVTGP